MYSRTVCIRQPGQTQCQPGAHKGGHQPSQPHGPPPHHRLLSRTRPSPIPACLTGTCHVAPCPGHLVSGFVKQQLPILLVNHLTTNPDPCSALVKGFLEVSHMGGEQHVR
jgi:hypothetical protein